LRNIRPLPVPRFVYHPPYKIGHGNIVQRPSRKGVRVRVRLPAELRLGLALNPRVRVGVRVRVRLPAELKLP